MMKWDIEIRGEHRIMHSGKFRILQTGSDVSLEHPSIPILFYPNAEIAKRVAVYLSQGGVAA